MPRVVKTSAPQKPAKKNKAYSMPEKIPEGTVLKDLHKRNWRVGPSIGIGGFGEIYTACKDGERNYEYVVKCEPHENGPLFVEMHFYLRHGKESNLLSYQKEKGLKSLGMPYMIANGSVALNGIDHRFIVMPRYGRNVEYYFLANGRFLPTATVYRLAIQMLDVLEYVHHCGYVHADLKASNMLLGYTGKKANEQAYLVDFGLASRYNKDRELKPDPKKAHNGTIEYTSRDAHQGMTTLRADLEILGYNLIHWLGAELPWVQNKLLASPVKVQAAKEEFMKKLDTELRKIFPEGVPAPLADYLKYVVKLNCNEFPDYKKCKKIFQDALKALKVSESGDLIMEATNKNKAISPGSKKAIKSKRVAAKDEEVVDAPERIASDDDDDDVVFESKPKRRIAKPGTLKATKVKTTPPKTSPKKTVNITPRRRISPRMNTVNSPSPTQKTKTAASPRTSAKKGTPLKARANINFSPAISLTKRSTPAARHGSTIINDNLTPNPRAGKTYEFNFELDVSLDANVVVNVKRKKRTNSVLSSASKVTPRTSSALTNGSSETPVKRVKVHNVNSGSDENKSSPRTPIVKVKKTKRINSPR